MRVETLVTESSEEPLDACLVTAAESIGDLGDLGHPNDGRAGCHPRTHRGAPRVPRRVGGMERRPSHFVLPRHHAQDSRSIPVRQEVDRANRLARLADAQRPPVALIDLHRVPGEVVVNDRAGALQIQAFRGQVGGDEDIGAAGAEAVDGLHRPPLVAQGELEGKTVVCPWHAWTFDVCTGVSPVNPRAKVETYPVKVEGTDLYIGI